VCGYTSPSRWPYDHFLHVSRTATSLSVEGSRLARRPPRKRRAAAFTPRSETTIGTGLNSSGRDDIQTMDRHVFRAVVLRRNGTENRGKQMAHSVADRCRSIPPVWACCVSVRFFRFVSWAQLSSFEGMGKNRRIEPRDNCRPPLCGNNPPARTARVGTRASDTCREEATARGNCRATCAAHVHRLALGGDTSRKGKLRTLRLGEAGSGDSEGSEATLGHPLICVPGVIARQIDVLPAKRGDMLKQSWVEGM
jgi:hypothetical protein